MSVNRLAARLAQSAGAPIVSAPSVEVCSIRLKVTAIVFDEMGFAPNGSRAIAEALANETCANVAD